MYLHSSTRGEIGYWRKANHIHGWFDRLVGGVVNQKQHPIKASDLEDLLDVCVRIKDMLIAGGTELKEQVVSKGIKDGEPYEEKAYVFIYRNVELAMKLLPPTEGFFFGSQDIDPYYLDDLDVTIDAIATALSGKEKGERFYYRAWW